MLRCVAFADVPLDSQTLAELLVQTETDRRQALKVRLHRSLRSQFRNDLIDDAMSMWTVELFRRLPQRPAGMPMPEWLRMVWRSTLAEACRSCRTELAGPTRQPSRGAPIEASVVLHDDCWVELPDPRLRHVRAMILRYPEVANALLSEPEPNANSTARRQRAQHLAVLRAELADMLRLEDVV